MNDASGNARRVAPLTALRDDSGKAVQFAAGVLAPDGADGVAGAVFAGVDALPAGAGAGLAGAGVADVGADAAV
ncbi:hypothetical protein B1M_23341, partial [Burkholderia sp. TJI49]